MKHLSRNLMNPSLEPFRAQLSAAPLKQPYIRANPTLALRSFRAQLSAAPLKRPVPISLAPPLGPLPRSIERGPVEALKRVAAATACFQPSALN